MQVEDGRVVSNFIVQALRGQPLTIYGDGSQTRSFCFVDDLIDALVRLMLHPDAMPTPINLGNPNEFTILELAELVIELTGSRKGVVFQPLPSDDPVQRCPDIQLAQLALGWKPRVPLREGLERTIAYFDRVLGGELRERKRRPAPKRALASTSAPLASAESTPRQIHNVPR
jgi:UDP-glucuronate decarboxylase